MRPLWTSPRTLLLSAALLGCVGQHAGAQGTPAQASPATGVGTAASGSAPVIQAPETRRARPGDYVTLTFVISGQGDYTFVASGEGAWAPITERRAVKLAGRSLLPVTFRVPAGAAVGPSPALTLRAEAGGAVVAQASARIDVLAQAKLALRTPARVEGASERTLTFPVEVVNLGNQPDTVALTITNVDQRPQLSARSVVLAPGESRTVTVSMNLGRTSRDYLFVTYLQATSGNDAGVVVRAHTDSVFDPAATLGDAATVSDQPTLTFGVSSAVDAGVFWTPEGRTATLSYRVTPIVSGALSDYVSTQARADGLQGSVGAWVPQGFSVGLRLYSARWSVDAQVGQSGLSVQGTAQRGAWTFAPRIGVLRYGQATRYAAGLGLSGPLAGGQVRADVSSTLYRVDPREDLPATSQRSDAFSVSYTRPLGERLGLSLGVAGSGQTGLLAGSGYAASLLGLQQLTYVGPNFDLTQTYSGTLGGLHTLGLTGGLRSVRPFGVRGGLVLQRRPGGLNVSASGLLLYSGPGGLGGSLGGQYSVDSDPAVGQRWQVSAALASPPLALGPVTLGAAARYTVAGGTALAGPPSQAAEVTANLTAGALRADGRASWGRVTTLSDGAQTTREALGLSLGANYQVGLNTFAARYTYDRQGESGAETADAASVQSAQIGWARQWGPRFQTQVDYGRSWGTNRLGTGSSDTFGVSAGLQDVLLRGLNFTAGYRLNAPAGLGGGNFTNAVRFTVGYDFTRAVATPRAAVNLFGGRVGGDVSGVLYRDLNANGARDPQEPGLGGVTVRAADVTAVSDAEGRYRLHLPVGAYTLSFPAGLPATLEALTPARVQVAANSASTVDVGLAPVGGLEVLVFQDSNRNGTRDPDEPPIPYAGVTVGGPVSRTIQADARGYAQISPLPAGTYVLSLGAAGLPEGFVATGEAVSAEIRAGVRQPGPSLGAAPPVRAVVNTYSAGNVALLGRLTPSTVSAGSEVTAALNVQRATEVEVQALGQSFKASVQSGRAEVKFSVPAGTAPGEYEVKVTARAADAEKTIVLRLLVAGRP